MRYDFNRFEPREVGVFYAQLKKREFRRNPQFHTECVESFTFFVSIMYIICFVIFLFFLKKEEKKEVEKMILNQGF